MFEAATLVVREEEIHQWDDSVEWGKEGGVNCFGYFFLSRNV